MSMVEKPHETPIEQSQSCPKCGAELGKVEHVNAQAVPGTQVCDACGTPLPQPSANGGNDATGRDNDLNGASPPPVPGRSRNPLALVVVAVVAAGMLYFGFHAARRSPGGTPHIAKSTPAPDFTLESLDGKSMRLSDLRGKAVLLNFWATWCGPCKIETPWLVELQNEYGRQGLQVVGVAMDDSSKQDIAKFAKDMGMNYPVLLGKEAVGDAYGGVPALPESFFIGRDGKIVDKIMGLEGKSEIEDAVKRALDTRPEAGQATGAPATSLQAQK